VQLAGAVYRCEWGVPLGLLIGILLAAFGLLQTRAGQTWLARTIAQTASSPEPFVSHLSFAFASRIVCHCMFETASGPPQASGRTIEGIRSRHLDPPPAETDHCCSPCAVSSAN
jgi:hypothetical protein